MTIDTSKEAVERLMDGVTPGPWEAGDHGRVEAYRGFSDEDQADYWEGIADVEKDADQRFIAAARKLVPALAAERDAQTARADAAEAEVARLKDERDRWLADWERAMVELDAKRKAFNVANAELTALRAGQDALVAAVCDVAASMIEDNMRHAAELGREIWPIPDIRALTPSDATAAMDAKLRAERNKVRREAARRIVSHERGTPMHSPPQLLTEAHDAILAMIEPEGK